MTEKIKQMTDAELDAAVAREVMGWRWFEMTRDSGPTTGWWDGEPGSGSRRHGPIWQPTRNGMAMLEVLERMRELGWCAYLWSHRDWGRWGCKFYLSGQFSETQSTLADTPTRAVAEAAYEAIEAEKGEVVDGD